MRTLSGVESLLMRMAGTALSRGGSLLIMIYHRVLPQRDPMMPSEPTADEFAAQIELLQQNFNVLPLLEAGERLKRGNLPPRAVSITFDDGYANNCEIAEPILRARRCPATVFVAPGFLNGGRMFNDTVIEAIRRAPVDLDLTAQGLPRFSLTNDAKRIEAVGDLLSKLKYLPLAERLKRIDAIVDHIGAELPRDLMMSDAQVQELHRRGIEIGAHTMNHPILASIDADVARTEIAQSKARLEEITGAPVRSFAYPNGKPDRDYKRQHVEIVKNGGFDLAVSTAWGAASAQSDAFELPRIAPWDKSPRRYAARMMNAYRDRIYQTAS